MSSSHSLDVVRNSEAFFTPLTLYIPFFFVEGYGVSSLTHTHYRALDTSLDILQMIWIHANRDIHIRIEIHLITKYRQMHDSS